MMALSEIGVEIGPLLAGAGIVGLAVGFGAQTLVKDFLTGLFLIIEDIVSVGDVARIGDSGGLVEDMSLRTIKLRDFDGTLHVIPYGEAQIIRNLTKGFSFYVFDLSISYSSDILKALDLMKETGDELMRDEKFSPLILEPIEVFGVDKLGDSGVVLKARIKTKPIQQWNVGREYLKRIKLAFDAHGIEIPFPHLKLVPPDQPFPVGDIGASRAAE
jgi:small conductance mechanosensitive channel